MTALASGAPEHRVARVPAPDPVSDHIRQPEAEVIHLSSAAHRDGPPTHSANALEVRSVRLHDPLVQPMLSDLSHEYLTRYERFLTAAELRAEMEQHPAAEFEPPGGELILVLTPGEDGVPVPIAGGAFRHRVEPELGEDALLTHPAAITRTRSGIPAVPTAELKRIWTDGAYRRRGLGGVVLRELEARARNRGYQRLYLTTGPRQPEAVALYLRGGYRPLFDSAVDPEVIGPHPFEKWLIAP